MSALLTSVRKWSQKGGVLNRIARFGQDGWQNEAYQRHADIIVQELGVAGGNGVGTSGAEDQDEGSKTNRRAC